MGLSARNRFVISCVSIYVLFVALLVALTIAFAEPLPPNSGSSANEEDDNSNCSPQGEALSPTRMHSEKAQQFSRRRRRRLADPPWGPSASGSYSSAAVTTDTSECSAVGVKVLREDGGTAVDAAVATMFCVGLVQPHSSGIGGGNFMAVWQSARDGGPKTMSSWMSRERAPQAAHRDMFVNNTAASATGGLAIAVPGEVMGLFRAWQKFGRNDWRSLVAPSADLARRGWTVSRSLASAIRSNELLIRSDPNFSEVFLNADQSLKQEDDTIVDHKLAATLDTIAEDPMSFYTGQLARDIVADIAEYDGIITEEDLAAYVSTEKLPLNISLSTGNYTVFAPPPPSSGVVLQFILNILDGYRMSPDSINPEQRVQTFHRMAESFKFAYAKRSDLGDEDFLQLDELLSNLTSADYSEGIRRKINETHTQPVEFYEPSFEFVEDFGTTHFSILAQDGSAVSLSSTVNLFFGSKTRGRRTGIIFNDEMDDFSTPGTNNSFGVPASPANFIEPGKMPMSSMCPTIVLDGEGQVRFIVGGAGGTRITTASAFVSMHSLWFENDLLSAVDEARIHHQLVPNLIHYEPHIDQELVDGLSAKYHDIKNYGSNIAVCPSIDNECPRCDGCPECIHAVSDGRKGGIPDGY